jgi:hypothetical protein
LQDTLGIHYDDLGSYKELFELVEAKAWRVNELVTFTIHLIEVTEDVIEVLAIDILPSFSNRCHGHVQEIWTSVFRKMADSNSVDLLVGLNSRLKRRTILLMLPALSHLFRCSAVGAFAFRQMDLLFRVVGYMSGFGGLG